MRRISVLAVIATIATFMVVSMVSAGKGNPWKNFHGTYEMISSGICLHSTSGWTATNPAVDGFAGWKLKEPVGQVWAGTATARATWVFNRGGTGTVEGTNYAAIFTGGSPPSYEAHNPFQFTFTYEITNNGVVSVTGTSGLANGVVMKTSAP